MLTNDVAVKVAEVEQSGGDFSQVHSLVSGKAQDQAYASGDVDAGMITVGMCGGLINDIPTCQELVSNIMTEAEEIIGGRLAGMTAA